MFSTVAALVLAASSIVSAQSSSTQAPFPPFSGDPFTKYQLSAKGINASFIPYGARLTNLYVHDKNGVAQDVVVGYDNGTQYLKDTETNHTYFGAVVGRYANRIKNGTFSIGDETYHIPTNEHGGADTLHGGFVGYDQRNWTIASHTNNSITFYYYDAAEQGFPGDLITFATYTLTNDEDGPSFTSRLASIPLNDATPVMLSNHIYWNLGAFVDEESLTVLNNTLYMPYAKRRIGTDGILVPNGQIQLTAGTGLDFTKPNTMIGTNIPKDVGDCGTGCTGIDNAFITDRAPNADPRDPGLEVLQMMAPSTGIQLSVKTNQGGLQIYSCDGQNGTIPVKSDQQHISGKTVTVEKYGCLVIETQDWIDGINQPEWGREEYQIFSTLTEPALNFAKFSFSVVKD